MSKGVWIVGIVIVLVVLGGIYWSMNGDEEVVKTVRDNVVEHQNEPAAATGNTIAITSSGFSPATITISPGVSVTFVNEDDNPHRPASGAHPTHRKYPGSDIANCGTDKEKGTFDACKNLLKGESYSFTFTERGEWSYHDHLNPGSGGVVIVR
ncbi:MAG: hypothetical protein RL557_55 [archaeon]